MRVSARVTRFRNLINQWGQFQLPHRATRLVGLDIGSRAMTLVQLEKSGRKFSLTRFAFQRLAPGLVQDGDILERQKLVSELRDLVGESRLSGQPVVLSVSGPSVLVKRMKISGVQPGDLAGYLQWEGHRYISHPVEEVCLDHQLLEVNGVDELDILLVVAKRDVVEDRQSVAMEAGLKPVGCDVDGLALANMASVTGFTSCAPHLNVNLETEGCTVVALDKGMPLFVRDVTWEEDVVIDGATGMKVNRIDSEGASEGLNGSGENAHTLNAGSIAGEIRRHLNFLWEKNPPTRVEHIQLSGDGATPGLCENLAEQLSLPVTLLNPFKGINIRDLHVNQDHVNRFGFLAGVAVGLASRSDCCA